MMGPSGSSTPIGGAQSVPSSLLRSNSGLMGGQGGSLPSQGSYSSLVLPRTQFNNGNMLGSFSNVPSLVNQPFGNGVGFSGQRGGMDTGAESDPLSRVGINNTPSPSNTVNPGSLGAIQGQQLELQNFQQGQQMRGGLAGVGSVKLEPQVINDTHGQQQLSQCMRNIGSAKLEPQHIQNLKNLGPVKMEPQHLDQSLFLHQQQFNHIPRQAPQAASILQQQRLLQLQQQQLLKSIPQQQRPQLPQQFSPQNFPLRSPVKPVYEPGMCARRLTHYMYQQQRRPEDNNIEFWRKFVAEYFAPNAKKRWCVSMYGSGRQTTGVFPQVGINNTPSPSNTVNPGSLGAIQGQQLELQNFQQGQQMRGGLAGVGSVKLEPQVINDTHGQQQLSQCMRNIGSAKLEPQHIQNLKNLGPVKMEPQHLDQSLFLHQQQFNHIPRQAPQAASILQQQRLLQLQQQQLLKSIPQQQRPQLPQQFSPQNFPLRSPVKPVYEPGMCARRLTHYMYQQQRRPEDNNIEFWRKFVAEYFAPNAKKRWCVSMYGSGRQTTGVFPQDALCCEICNRKPGRGFEATVEVLPRLYKIKYESGTLEELLYVDMPREYQNSSGQIVLDYAKAIQESVFQQLRVVRDGQLRIVFSPDLKIVSWEFCAWRHEELISRRLLIPQVTEFGAAAQKCQPTQNASANLSTPELQSNCNTFVTSARKLAKALEVPLVNDLGYTKRYIRCLQISEVVNSMKDLIDYSRETKTGPMESLAKYPRRTNSSPRPHSEAQQFEDQQMQMQTPHQQQPVAQNTNNEQQSSVLATAVQLASNNAIGSVNNPHNTMPVSSSNTSAVVGLLHQNSMKSRQQSSTNNNASCPYGVQMPSPGSSNTILQPQAPTPSNPQTSHSSKNSPASIPVVSNKAEQPSKVEKILKEMMMSSHLNSGSGSVVVGLDNDVKSSNAIFSSGDANNNNTLFNSGNGTINNNNPAGMGGTTGFTMMNGMRGAMDNNNNNNSVMNGRVMVRDQHDLVLGGLGAVNGFDNLNFDWKSSP